MATLTVESLTAGYKGIPAVRNVGFSCEPGEVISILGPNGAGKSTTLLAIGGAIKPISGAVTLDGVDVTGWATHQMARHGVVLIPDDRGVFHNLTVGEHLTLSERSAPAKRKKDTRISRQDVLDRFPQLAGLTDRRCGLLSGGEQQMLAIAKALLLQPSILLVDELSLGLAPVIVQALLPTLSGLARDTGMGLVLVEQHFELALAASNKGVVMNHGEVVLAGPASDWLADPSALESAYFGSN